MANKFLLVDDKFLFSSNVKYHRELIGSNRNKESISGGGWWHMDTINKRFYCFDKSEDFGPAKKEDIIRCLKNSHLSHRLEGFSFFISDKIYIKDVLEETKDKDPDWIHKIG